MKKEGINPKVCGILVAAGNGERMLGLGVTKQLYPINGFPVIVHTIKSFLQCKAIHELVLVCRPEQVEQFSQIAHEHIKDIAFTIVEGGKNRQQSVFNGINAASEKSDYYAIHDGVRPLVTPEEISDCVDMAVKYKAATLGVAVKETIKIVDGNGTIISTPDRSTLYSIQTPQIFQAELYKKAMNTALKEDKVYTDDCQLVENIGHKVAVCEGSYENIKITTLDDIIQAKAIMNYRNGEN